MGNMADFERDQGRLDEAERHVESALAIFRETSDRRFEGSFLGLLGRLASWNRVGRTSRDLTPNARWPSIRKPEIGGLKLTPLETLGLIDRERGCYDSARTHLEAALDIHREVGDRSAMGMVLADLASVHLRQGRMKEARGGIDLSRFAAARRRRSDRSRQGRVPARRARASKRRYRSCPIPDG